MSLNFPPIPVNLFTNLQRKFVEFSFEWRVIQSILLGWNNEKFPGNHLPALLSFLVFILICQLHANNKNSFKNHTSSVGKKIVIKRCIFWYDKNIFLVDLGFQSSFLKKKLNQMEFLNEKCCVFNLETRHFKFLRTKSLLKVELLKKYGRL